MNLSCAFALAVIKDANTSKENNIFLGTKGILSVFSFYGNKNFTTGEGGMIVGNKKLILKFEKQTRDCRYRL